MIWAEPRYRVVLNLLLLLLLYAIYMQTLQDSQALLSEYGRANLKDSIPQDIVSCINDLQNSFVISMSDDLHTPVVLAALSDPLKTINDLLHTRKVFNFLADPQFFFSGPYTRLLCDLCGMNFLTVSRTSFAKFYSLRISIPFCSLSLASLFWERVCMLCKYELILLQAIWLTMRVL